MMKNDPGDTTMRNKLLRTCLDKGMSASTVLQLVKPMAGKSNEEKERIAAEILKKRDIDYLDAVKRGDMETAQKMVDEA